MGEAVRQCEVLVIDDEQVVRDGVARILESAGFTVASVESAQAALCHPCLSCCRLILCDLMLPDERGTSLPAALAARGLTMPVLMITGYATSASIDEALAAGAAGVLPKPFDEEELLTAVTRALGRAGERKP